MNDYKELIRRLTTISNLEVDKNGMSIQNTALEAIAAINDLMKRTECTIENTTAEPISDAAHHPSHYAKGGVECIEAIKASMTDDGFCDYCKGNVIKYLWRWRDKGGTQDLEKASVYLNWLVETAKGDKT